VSNPISRNPRILGSMRLIPALAAFVLLLALAGSAGADSPTLFGTTGPGLSIRLSDASGNPVTHLDPGTYTIQIEDRSAEHNFDLRGPGVSKATEIETTGTVTWTVALTDGVYTYQCDAHSLQMHGSFAVGSATIPTTPPATKPAAVELAGSVGPGAKITLKKGAARVRTLTAGRATITVHDVSTKDNFHLTGPGVNKKTSIPGKATATWKVNLRAGTYTYRSDASPKLKGSFLVTV
jgi:hypothetical protein